MTESEKGGRERNLNISCNDFEGGERDHEPKYSGNPKSWKREGNRFSLGASRRNATLLIP